MSPNDDMVSITVTLKRNGRIGQYSGHSADVPPEVLDLLLQGMLSQALHALQREKIIVSPQNRRENP